MTMANSGVEGQEAGGEAEGGEVHMVLTGSPRPTFAETNAWLLESQTVAPTTPKKTKNGDNSADDTLLVSTPGSFRGSYSIADNNVQVPSDDDASMGSADNDVKGGAELLQEYIAECTHNSSTANANMDDLGGSPTRLGGSVLGRYRERKESEGNMSAGGNNDDNAENDNGNNYNDDNENGSNNNKGPMVGHAVVNAISHAPNVGLQCTRAQLLQGTIDRPLWDQRRWTDGECLFSELVDKCGLESFKVFGEKAPTGTTRLQKDNKLGAHLITVPAPVPTANGSIMTLTKTNANAGNDGEEKEEVSGMEEDVIEEIARGILRCLKRKKSPPASKVYLVLPPNSSSASRHMASTRLSAAFQKLEKYNDMIGAPKLMANAELEFVEF